VLKDVQVKMCMKNEVRIKTKKDDGSYADYCAWYLGQVRKKSTSGQMSSYAVEHKLVGNNMSINGKKLSWAMKNDKQNRFDTVKEGRKTWYILRSPQNDT
jgi:hypothetical protein